MSVRTFRATIGRRALAGATAVLAFFATGVGTAAAQTPFQSTYRAYGAWDEGNSALPDKCTQTQAIYGSEPAAPGRYPVLVYLHGTLADWGNNVEGQRVAQLAARQGFVTAAFTYDSWVVNAVTGIDGNARCMFSPGSSGNALASVCARPKADCSRGVAVAGFSTGGAIAARARNFAPQVRAAWLLGVNGPAVPEAVAPPAGSRALPNNRVRIVVGRSELADLSALNALTGSSCSTSPCFRANRSGYYVVPNAAVADGIADHCWWQSVNRAVPTNSCTWTPAFDPAFAPPSRAPGSLTTNLNWLRGFLG